jgi:hypothetical protein
LATPQGLLGMTAKTRIVVVVALLVGAGAVLLVLNLTWLVAILAGGALLVGIPGFVAGTPRLRLEVRNDQSGTATLTRDTSSSSLTVWLVSDGRGAAESIEVTMDAGSSRVYNESGNSTDPSVLDQTVHPMRWHDHSRRVGPHARSRLRNCTTGRMMGARNPSGGRLALET